MKKPIKKINFSYDFRKLRVWGLGGTKIARLLEVFTVEMEKISMDFLHYDTEGFRHDLPGKGRCLLLIFRKNADDLFTTFRRWSPEKESFYRGSIGDTFAVRVTPKGDSDD